MPILATISYNDPDDFTYDSDLINISTYTSLKVLEETNRTFLASFYDSINAQFGAGSLTGTGTNSPTISSNKLSLTGGSTKYLDFSASSNISSATIMTVRFKYTPNYTGNPSGTRTLFAIGTVGSTNGTFSVTNDGSGLLNPILRNDTGGSLVSGLYAWSPVAGTEYEFEVSIGAAGFKIYIDGTQVFSGGISAGSRTLATVQTIRIGGSLSTTHNSNQSYRDFEIYSTQVHTANFTGEVPRDVYTYSPDNPKITLNSATGMTKLFSFSETATKDTNTEIKYTIKFQGQEHYIVDGALAVSDGTYSQTSTATEINDAIAGDYLDIDPDSIVYLVAYLHGNGYETLQLTSVEWEHSAFRVQPSIDRCYVTGYVYDTEDGFVEGALVSVKILRPLIRDGATIDIDTTPTETDANGFFSLYLPVTEDLTVTVVIKQEWTNSQGHERSRTFRKYVPNSDQVTIDEMTDSVF